MTRRHWLIVAVVAWGVILLVGALWSAQADPATVREQSTLAQGQHTVVAAAAEVQRAAGPGVGVESRPYELTTGCRLSLTWRGTELAQVLVLTVPAGQEPALLGKLAERLPAQWGARHYPNRDRLLADAGDFVAVRADVAEPGEVHVTFNTGCRLGELPQ